MTARAVAEFFEGSGHLKSNRLRDRQSRSFGALDIFIGGLWADVADERQRVDFLEFGSHNIASLETLRLLAIPSTFELLNRRRALRLIYFVVSVC